MSTDLPFFYNYYNPLLAGEDYGGLMQLWPLFLQQMQGYPIQFPGTIAERGGYNYYDNYWLSQMTNMNSASFAQARELDAESQGAMLSLITKRVLESTTGGTLTQKQLGIIRQVADFVGRNGLTALTIARRVLQQQGIEDETGQRIDGILGIIENTFDATYGPTGSRMPFYGSVKKSLVNLVPIEKQDDILQEAMQKMFPLQQDTQATGGYGARQVAELHTYLSRVGHNAFNTESNEVKKLVQQKMEGGLKNLSRAEQTRYIQTAQRQATERLFKGITNRAAKEAVMGDTTDDKVNYVNALNNIESLNTAVRNTGKFAKTKDISGMTIDEMGKLAADLSEQSTALAKQEELRNELKKLQDQENKSDEDKQQIKNISEQIVQNEKASNYYKKLSDQVKAFSEKASKVDTFRRVDPTNEKSEIITATEFNRRVEEAQMNLFKNAVKSNEQTKNLVNDDELNNYAKTFIIQDRLKRVKGLDTKLLDLDMSTATEERIKAREEYLDDILNDRNKKYSDDVKEDIRALYTKEGQTQAYADYNQFYKTLGENIQNATSLQQIFDEYNAIPVDDADARQRFRALHPELARFEAQIVASGGSEYLQREARNVSRMQSAIASTGGGTVNGKPILSVAQVAQTMDMIAQMTGRDRLSDEAWEDYWTKIAYTMTQSGTNINEVQQMAGIAARGAARFGGDRGMASMAAVEFGMAARQIAAENNLNPERVGILSAQAVGAASNSQLSHFTRAFSFLLNGKDINSYKNLDPKYKEILKKIQNKQSLTNEERQTLENKGFEMMNQMDLSAEDQSELLNMAITDTYSINIGAAGELTRYTYGISRNALNSRFRNIGATEEEQDKLRDSLFNIFVKNKAIREDESGKLLRDELIKEAEKEGISKEVIDQIKGIDAQNLWRGASRALQEVANNQDDGNINNTIDRLTLSDSIGDKLDKNATESRIKKILPFSSQSTINAISEAITDPNSNLGSFVKALMTGDHLTSKEKEQVANALALVSLASKDVTTGVEAGFKTDDDLKKLQEAGDLFNEVFRRTGQDVKVFEAFDTLQYSLSRKGYTLQQARSKSEDELAKEGFTDEEIRLIKDTEITEEQIKNANTAKAQFQKHFRERIEKQENNVQETLREFEAPEDNTPSSSTSIPKIEKAEADQQKIPVNSASKVSASASEEKSSGTPGEGSTPTEVGDKLDTEGTKRVEVIIVEDRTKSNSSLETQPPKGT